MVACSGLKNRCQIAALHPGANYNVHARCKTDKSTNIATASIQVGPWVDLQVEEMPVVDGYNTMGVGQLKTVTLTLQNPRGDGAPFTGFWSLGFNPDVLDVFDIFEKE